MFNIRFKVVEILNEVTVTRYLHGKRKDVKKDIDMYKARATRYEMMGSKGMIVWG